jgi:hypothetical protein
VSALLWILFGLVLGKVLDKLLHPKRKRVPRLVSRDPTLNAGFAAYRQAEYDAQCARPFMRARETPQIAPYDHLEMYRPKLET